MTALFAD